MSVDVVKPLIEQRAAMKSWFLMKAANITSCGMLKPSITRRIHRNPHIAEGPGMQLVLCIPGPFP